jgi:hypothetical protein
LIVVVDLPEERSVNELEETEIVFTVWIIIFRELAECLTVAPVHVEPSAAVHADIFASNATGSRSTRPRAQTVSM